VLTVVVPGQVNFAMNVFDQIAAASLLLALTLCLQVVGITALIEWLKRILAHDRHKQGPAHSAKLVVESLLAILVLHVLTILLWATCYRWSCFPSWDLAFYFSASSYSTVGYGDVVLPPDWRLLGPVESIIGVLMCGISVSILFALVSRLVDRDHAIPERMTADSAAESLPLPMCPQGSPEGQPTTTASLR
jgi:voltage-gated potassium channel